MHRGLSAALRLSLIVILVLQTLALNSFASGQTDPVIAAAGDIACDPADSEFNGGQGTATRCHMSATAQLILGRSPAVVLTLGDNQYENGALDKFMQSYDPTWGQFKSITHPSVGNHEYGVTGAAGYFDYFGQAAGEGGKGYYSFDVGAWHLIALNSNCSQVGGCGLGSPQEQWLRNNLAQHSDKACILAYWHHPRFSSGMHGNNTAYDAFWRALYDAGADVILVGHDHTYERFAPQDPDANADPARGIRQFVAGTGGKSLYSFPTIRPNSEVRNADTYGVLLLTLHSASYDWEFVPEPGKTFTDTGSTACSLPAGPAPDQPPTVDVTKPANGETVSGKVRITATAGDDRGVSRVEFRVDGILIGADSTAPYSAQWTTKSWNRGLHTITAMAVDKGGQTATDAISVTLR